MPFKLENVTTMCINKHVFDCLYFAHINFIINVLINANYYIINVLINALRISYAINMPFNIKNASCAKMHNCDVSSLCIY